MFLLQLYKANSFCNILKKLINCSILFKIGACCLLFWVTISYADPDNPEKDINTNCLQAIALHNSVEWGQFVDQKESADINYDLYRINGPNVNDRVIVAQDPKGYLVDKHNEMFCSMQIDKKCQINSPLYTHADMRASVLIHNSYHNLEDIKLATEVIRNIVNPFPSNVALEMRDASVRDRELTRNKSALAETYAIEARLGVVRNSFNSMLLNRLPLDLLKGKSSSEKKNLSILGIMEQEAKDRFANAQWQTSIEQGNNDVFLKELAKMEAFKIWMDYHKYKQNERIESLLATMVAQQSDLQQLLINKNAKNN